MKFEKTEVWGFDHALRGMRNLMNSWDKSDSGYYGYCSEDDKWVKNGDTWTYTFDVFDDEALYYLYERF